MQMEDWIKERFGHWTQAVGTVLAAVGSTPALVEDEAAGEDLQLVGNVMQATGNGVLADTEIPWSLAYIGEGTQAIGNTVVVAGLALPLDENTKNKLGISGDLLQALGTGVGVAADLEREPSLSTILFIYADLLQMIGNSLQAVGGSFTSEEVPVEEADGEGMLNKWEIIFITGSWIQAVGAVLDGIAYEVELQSRSTISLYKNQFARPQEYPAEYVPVYSWVSPFSSIK